MMPRTFGPAHHPRYRRVGGSSFLKHLGLLAALALVLAPPSAQAQEEAGTGLMYLLAGDGTLAAPAIDGDPVLAKCTADDCINLAQQNTAYGPDGTIYIADSHGNIEDPQGVILRLDGDMVSTVVSGLDNPWGIDVDSSGVVYFAEYQAFLGESQGAFVNGGPPHTAGRVWRYDPTAPRDDENPRVVAEVPGAADVRVGPQNFLYVASRNWHGTGGVWKVDISGDLPVNCNSPAACTQLLPPDEFGKGFDSEGIALFADAQGNQRLYVAAYGAAFDPDGAFGGADDRCIWEIDLNQVTSGADVSCVGSPPLGYQVVQQPEFPPVPVVPPLQGNMNGWVNDVEFDSSGTLHALLGTKTRKNESPFALPEDGYGWGGKCPRVFAFRPGETSFIRNFGNYSDGCSAYGPSDPPDDGAPAAQQWAFYGSSVSLGNGRSLLLSYRNGGPHPAPHSFETYDIRNDVLGVAAPRIYFPTQCEDGVDNNGNQLIDWQYDQGDQGCETAADISEQSIPCDDGVDNDADGPVDYLDDIGCRDIWDGEWAGCSDGDDNDGDGKRDFDGGVWAGVPEPTDPDPECVAAWYPQEAAQGKGGCGAPTVQATDDARGLMALAPFAIAMLALLGYGIVRSRRAS